VHLLRRALGETDSSRPWPLPDLRLSADERACGRAMLVRIDGIDAGSEDGPAVIGLFANATGNKRLEQAWWRALLERLPAGTSAKPPVEIVPAFGRSLLDDRYPAFFCTDLRKLAATLSALDVLVTGDCGVMHWPARRGAGHRLVRRHRCRRMGPVRAARPRAGGSARCTGTGRRGDLAAAG
jgi:hypothetical protein